jgi:hypothetical protein
VAAGKLDESIAEQIQTAFAEAVFHIKRRCMGTCYTMFPVLMHMRRDLLEQANALTQASSNLDPATVAQARAAITRDMAYFETIDAWENNYRWVKEQYGAAGPKPSPEAQKAARLLTELLLGTSD